MGVLHPRLAAPTTNYHCWCWLQAATTHTTSHLLHLLLTHCTDAPGSGLPWLPTLPDPLPPPSFRLRGSYDYYTPGSPRQCGAMEWEWQWPPAPADPPPLPSLLPLPLCLLTPLTAAKLAVLLSSPDLSCSLFPPLHFLTHSLTASPPRSQLLLQLLPWPRSTPSPRSPVRLVSRRCCLLPPPSRP